MATYNVRSKFNVVAMLDDIVAIEDLDGLVSVTNDAERVVKYLHALGMGDRRLIYRDSEEQWDEIVHDSAGSFMGFRPIRSSLLNEALHRVREAA